MKKKLKSDSPLRAATFSPSSRRYKCDECHDTGYFGDMGPGRAGNNEYVPCDCRRDTRADDEKWRDHFVLPIAKEMKARGVAYMLITIRADGKAEYVLEPNEPECLKCAQNGWSNERNGPCPKFPNCEESFPENARALAQPGAQDSPNTTNDL